MRLGGGQHHRVAERLPGRRDGDSPGQGGCNAGLLQPPAHAQGQPPPERGPFCPPPWDGASQPASPVPQFPPPQHPASQCLAPGSQSRTAWGGGGGQHPTTGVSHRDSRTAPGYPHTLLPAQDAPHPQSSRKSLLPQHSSHVPPRPGRAVTMLVAPPEPKPPPQGRLLPREPLRAARSGGTRHRPQPQPQPQVEPAPGEVAGG